MTRRECNPWTGFKNTHGTYSWSAKINDDIVREIRRQYQSGKDNNQIAKDMNLSYSIVYGVTSGKRWRHVK